MRLATNYNQIHNLGAEVLAVSVDDDERQAAMAIRWGLSHTAMISDPEGETILQPLGLYDPEDRGGVALPAVLVYGADGQELYRYAGRDFADRTTDEAVYAFLESIDLPPIQPEPWVPPVAPSQNLSGFFRPEDFGSYFRGNMFAALAISRRVRDEESMAAASQHQKMAKATLDAWQKWRPMTPSASPKA